MIDQLKSELLALIPDPDNMEFNIISSGASVYFFGTKALEICFQKTQSFIKIASEEGVKKGNDVRPFLKFSFQDASIIQQQRARILAAYDYFKSIEKVESFGCCHDFIACSDQKECVHKDDPENRGCMYRKNLEAGRIFYGKNKNIE